MITNQRLRFLFLASAFSLIFSPVSADDTSVAALPLYQPGSGITEESVDKIVEWALNLYEVPGVAIAIVKDGEIFKTEGYGIRDVDNGEPVDEETLFQLASVSKTFTAATFAAAVDAKKLKWRETTAQDVLPGFQMYTPYATQWVNGTDYMVHRSGFPGFFGDLFDHFGYSRSDIQHRMRFVKPAYSFRDHPEYSNLGFFLAGEMVAEVEGLTFEESVEKYITGPIGMTHTGKAERLFAAEETKSNVAASHAEMDQETVVVPHNLSKVFVAAGGLASNAKDMAAYVKMLVNNGEYEGTTVLSEDAIEQIFDPVISTEIGFSEFPPIGENTGFNYSPGWGVFHYNGLKVLEKGGALDGVRTIVVLVPEKKFGIAILANMNLTALPEAVRAGILQQMFGVAGEEDFQPAIYERAMKLHDMLFGSIQEPTADKSLTPEQIDAFVGSYINDLYGVWTVAYDEKKPAQLVLLSGPAEYKGKVTVSDPKTLTVEWPIVISGPEEIPFDITEGESATSFDFDGYKFRRLGN